MQNSLDFSDHGQSVLLFFFKRITPRSIACLFCAPILSPHFFSITGPIMRWGRNRTDPPRTTGCRRPSTLRDTDGEDSADTETSSYSFNRGSTDRNHPVPLNFLSDFGSSTMLIFSTIPGVFCFLFLV